MRRYQKPESMIVAPMIARIGMTTAYDLLAIAVMGCIAPPKEQPPPTRLSGTLAACYADCRTGCESFFGRGTPSYDEGLFNCRDECRILY